MAKKTSKATRKKTSAKPKSLARTVKGTATAVLGEVEKAGDMVLTEVKDGLGAVTDKITTTAKGMAETQAALILKKLVDEVEEIGSGVVDAVSAKLDHLRGKVEESHAEAGAPVKKKAASKKKAAAKKKAVAKKKATKKKAVSKKKATAKKKATTKKAVAKKKAVTKKKTSKKKAAPKTKKTTARKKTAARKKVSRR